MKTSKLHKTVKKLDEIMMRLDRIETLFKDLALEKLPEDDLLTVAQTSKLVNLSFSTIYSKVSRKEIPAFKIGKRLYFSRVEIVAWIKSGKIKTIAEIRNEIS